MREEFLAGGLNKLGGLKDFTFTDNTIIFGKEEIPYIQMSTINLITAPTPITNGIAQFTVNGKIRTLAYRFKERERFLPAMNYANSQIERMQGITKNYKYMLHAHTGTKLEVYEDYIILYFMPTDSVIANIARGGSTGGKRLPFDTITSIQFMEPAGISVGFIQFSYPGSIDSKAGVIAAFADENSIPVSPENLELARKIVNYIEEKRTTVKTQTAVNEQSSADELLKFKKLLDSGIITQDEFDAKKKQLLRV